MKTKQKTWWVLIALTIILLLFVTLKFSFERQESEQENTRLIEEIENEEKKIKNNPVKTRIERYWTKLAVATKLYEYKTKTIPYYEIFPLIYSTLTEDVTITALDISVDKTGAKYPVKFNLWLTAPSEFALLQTLENLKKQERLIDANYWEIKYEEKKYSKWGKTYSYDSYNLSGVELTFNMNYLNERYEWITRRLELKSKQQVEKEEPKENNEPEEEKINTEVKDTNTELLEKAEEQVKEISKQQIETNLPTKN